MVIYECNERLFARQKAFAAIEDYIPTLSDMGVTVLWLMPVQPRGKDSKSVGSPYCISNFRSVEPALGTMDDLKALVNTAHNHGMRVMLDWVANHTSWDNPWVKAHPDWYQEAQTSDEKLWKDVTFLNYNVQEVCDTMQACMTYWIDEADIDGFRCDYASGVSARFWKDAIAEIRRHKSDAIMLAESSTTNLYAAGFDLLYSWNYMYAIEKLYMGTGSFNSLLSTSETEYKSTPNGKERMRYITTHDESSEKAPSSVYHSAQGELSAFCLTAFLAGVPMIYSSQELGHMNAINFFNYQLLDFKSENATRNALKAILNAYRETEPLRAGTRETGALNNKVPYIEYSDETEAMIIICNTANSEQEVTYPEAYQGTLVTDLLTGEPAQLATTTTLAPYEYRIYKH